VNEAGRILIVRHAQSLSNAGGVTTDTASIPITDKGVLQAQCVAELVTERPSLIAVSGYLRTVQTAEPLVRRYPGVPVETWPMEEFTYLNEEACAGTTHAERKALRDAYWNRLDPLRVEGPGCESFAGFMRRVEWLEQKLKTLSVDETVVAFTHGFVMRALIWLRRCGAGGSSRADMADFHRFQHGISVPNCAVMQRAGCEVSVAHIPEDLRTG
jgi:broad specificity phosphatase PhoE